MTPGGHLQTHSRRGSLLVEIVVCTVLLSVVASVLVPGVRAISRQRKASRFDTLALVELNNLAAICRQRGVDALKFTPAFESRYPECTFETETRDDDQLSMRRVTFTLTRPGVEALPDVVRTLTIWLPNAEESQSGSSAEAESPEQSESSGQTESPVEEATE